MQIKHLIVGVLLLLSLQAGVAIAQAKPVMIYGLGNRSCGEWTSEKSIPHQYVANRYWLEGFVSAAGFYVDKSFFPPSASVALTSWIDNYCQKNPLDMVNTASIKLVKELQNRHQQ